MPFCFKIFDGGGLRCFFVFYSFQGFKKFESFWIFYASPPLRAHCCLLLGYNGIQKVVIKHIASKNVENRGLNHSFYKFVDFFSPISKFTTHAIAFFYFSLETLRWWMQLKNWLHVLQFPVFNTAVENCF